ncbi:heme-binding domain-containing protein, partial [Akkermansiaceae bacterium]|nr:heme-binding domain-containing protein [Akkermansiaceae bacterium]
MAGFLANYCYDCHDETQKGDIRLDNLAALDNPKRLDLLNRMQEQVYFRHMPPKKKDQPDERERKVLLDFLSGELAKYDASTLEGKLQKAEFGNYVDHEKLFSGEYLDLPAFTTDRRWLISEFIYNAKFQR